jgi:hypothetical protein
MGIAARTSFIVEANRSNDALRRDGVAISVGSDLTTAQRGRSHESHAQSCS